VLRLTLRSIWSRKRRSAGTAAAIVLGVAFLTATLVLGDTLDAGIGGLFRRANAGTDVVVRAERAVAGADGAARPSFDGDLLAVVDDVDGVAAAAAEIGGVGQVLGRDGRPVGGGGPPTNAQAWIADDDLNPYDVAAGRAPAAAGEAVVDRGTAERGEVAIGDRITVLTPDPIEVELVGLVEIGGRKDLLGSTYVGLHPAEAIERYGADGAVTEIRARATDDVDAEALRSRVAAALPAGADLQVQTGVEVADELQADLDRDFTGFLQVFLLAFAAIAVVVATFTIANTLTIVAAQRTRESALLRAVGATRQQVLGSMLVESFVLSLVASAVGLGVGLGLAGVLRGLLAGLGLDLSGVALVVEPATVVVALGVGVVATLLAALAPAARAARTRPIEALRASAAEAPTLSRWRSAAGAAIGVLGVAAVVGATRSDEQAMAIAGLGSLLLLAATVLLAPLASRPVAAVLGAPVAAVGGVPGRLARRNAMRNPRRTAGASMALVIGAAVVALFATFGASLRASLADTVDQTFGGDLVVAPSTFSGAPLSPQLSEQLAALPEVDRAVGMANVIGEVEGSIGFPTAADPAGLAALVDLDVQQGSLGDMAPGQVAIDRRLAEDRGLALGDPLEVEYLDGDVERYEIAAVYGVRDLLGDVLLTPEDWAAHATTPGDLAVLIELRDGVRLDEGRAAVERVADRFGAPPVEDREQYIDRMGAMVDQLLAVVYGLLGLAIVIALLGLGTALSLAVHERTRELGLLRAIGLTRRGVRASVRWEAMITAVLGTVVGLAVGGFLGWGLVRALAHQEGFVSFQAPTTTLVAVVVLAVAAGVAASLRPAQRAARLDVLDAIADA
jgi:putative ABC transport system permease protein